MSRVVAVPPCAAPPDKRHAWLRRWLEGLEGTPDEWRCLVCGELALRNVLTGGWEFMRPRLRDKSEPWHFADASHDCAKRDWEP